MSVMARSSALLKLFMVGRHIKVYYVSFQSTLQIKKFRLVVEPLLGYNLVSRLNLYHPHEQKKFRRPSHPLWF